MHTFDGHLSKLLEVVAELGVGQRLEDLGPVRILPDLGPDVDRDVDRRPETEAAIGQEQSRLSQVSTQSHQLVERRR